MDEPETKTPLPSRRVSVLCWRVMSSAPSTKIAPPRYRPQSPPDGTPHGFIVTAQQSSGIVRPVCSKSADERAMSSEC